MPVTGGEHAPGLALQQSDRAETCFMHGEHPGIAAAQVRASYSSDSQTVRGHQVFLHTTRQSGPPCPCMAAHAALLHRVAHAAAMAPQLGPVTPVAESTMTSPPQLATLEVASMKAQRSQGEERLFTCICIADLQAQPKDRVGDAALATLRNV